MAFVHSELEIKQYLYSEFLSLPTLPFFGGNSNNRKQRHGLCHDGRMSEVDGESHNVQALGDVQHGFEAETIVHRRAEAAKHFWLHRMPVVLAESKHRCSDTLWCKMFLDEVYIDQQTPIHYKK